MASVPKKYIRKIEDQTFLWKKKCSLILKTHDKKLLKFVRVIDYVYRLEQCLESIFN